MSVTPVAASSSSCPPPSSSSSFRRVGGGPTPSEVTCGICRNLMHKPKVLSCLHTFCLQCLINSQSSEKWSNCPLCGDEVTLSTKGVECLPSNFYVNSWLMIMTIQNQTSCTNCDENQPATSRCFDCSENLCQSCVAAHERIKQTKRHHILSFDELRNNLASELVKTRTPCSVHDEEDLRFFCETCDEAICRDCALNLHREHNYLDLREALKVHQPAIVALQDQLRRKVPLIKLGLTDIGGVIQSLKTRKTLVKEAVESTVSSHIRALEDHKAMLIEKLDEIFSAKESVLTEQLKRVSQDMENITTASNFVENLLHFGNEVEIMAVKNLVSSRLNELIRHHSRLEPEENDVIKFFTDEAALLQAINRLGHLTSNSTVPKQCCVVESDVDMARVGLPVHMLIVAKDRSGNRNISGGDHVIVKVQNNLGHVTNAEVVDNQDGSYVVTLHPQVKGKHTVSVFVRDRQICGSPIEFCARSGVDMDSVEEAVMKFGLQNDLKVFDTTFDPWGVVEHPQGLWVVSDHNNHKIHFFNAEGEAVFSFGNRGKNDGELWYPAGVAVDSNGHLVVADFGNNRITVWSINGQFLGKFGTKGSGEGQFRGPCGVVIGQDGVIFVADRDNSRVQSFDQQYNFLSQFGNNGPPESRLNSPRHLAVGSDGDIYVTDTNNCRLQRYSRHGIIRVTYGSRGSSKGQFQSPSGLAVDSEGVIIATDAKLCSLQFFSTDAQVLKVIESEPNRTAPFVVPHAVSVLSTGRILVADRGQKRVLLM